MPWTKTSYPASMKNLPEVVRDKAIEIANAISRAKQSSITVQEKHGKVQERDSFDPNKGAEVKK